MSGPAAERLSLETGEAPEGERKTVTALFADIQGSMELIEDLDPEQARAIIDPAVRVMIDAVHRYDGYIVQSTGDGIFALFGAPAAHEDHPQRALYAALRMQEELRRYSVRLREAGNRAMEARVGVNTGEVVVRSIKTGDAHAEYTPIGHSTSLAARMQALAPTGSVVITDQTRGLCEGYFTFKRLGPARIKGVSEPVNVVEVTGLGPLRTRLQAAAQRGLTKFVGRHAELEQMKRALELARQGHGQVVAAMGEPGVGKSRLFFEFKAIAQSGCLVLEAYSVSHGRASAYLPVTELLRSYFRINPEDQPRQRREQIIGKVLGLDRSLEDTLPYVFALMAIQEGDDPLAGMDAQIRRRRTQEALKRIVLRESLNQPLLLVFEDLHWIDAETQSLLDLLAGSIANARILLIVNYRPDYRHEWSSRTNYTQLRLDPLASESAELMLTALLGDSGELEPLRRMIAERTQGNPFFIEEIVQSLFDDGVLVRNGAVRMSRRIADIKVPQTVQSILTSRIDRLPADQKELLRTLAVVGREFPLGLVKHLVGQPDEDLDRMLSDLQVGEFIYEQPAFPEVKYTFKHALTQEAAYNSLLIERRKQLHGHAAIAIEALYGERLDDHLSELARHYQQSGDAWKAVKYLHRAAQQAAARLIYEETVTHLVNALEILGTLPEGVERDRQEMSLRMNLNEYLIAVRGPGAADVAVALARSQDLCEKLGEDARLFWVRFALQFFHLLRLELKIARELGERQLALAERSGDPSMLMGACAPLVETLFHVGEFRAAHELCKRAIALHFVRQTFPLSEIGDPQTMIMSRFSHLLFILGYPERALASSREALSAARQSGPHSLALALSYAVEFHRELGDEATARELTQALASLAAERGFSLWVAQARFLQGQALIAEGQVEEGIAELRQGVTSFEATGAVPGNWKLYLAWVYGKLGRVADALAAIAGAQELIEGRGLLSDEALLYRVKGELSLRQAAPESTAAAESAFRQAIEIARGQSAKVFELRATTSLARLLAVQGNRSEARAMLAGIYNWFTEGFDTVDLKNAKAVLDDLATPG